MIPEISERLNKPKTKRNKEINVNDVTHARIKELAKLHDATMTSFIEAVIEVIYVKAKEKNDV